MKSIKTILLAVCLYLPFIAGAQYGQLDSSFSEDGVAFFHLPGGGCRAVDMEVLPDGKLLVLGTVFMAPGGYSDIVLLRYNEDGSLDPSFGSGGMASYDYEGRNDTASDMAVLPDGRIVFVGYSLYEENGSDKYHGLAYRVLPDGELDASWGGGGPVNSDFELTPHRSMKIAVLPDGKIFWGFVSSSFRSRLGRYYPDGILDTEFGVNGYVSLNTEYSNTVKWVFLPNGGIIIITFTPPEIFNGAGRLSFVIYSHTGTNLSHHINLIGNTYSFMDAQFHDTKIVCVGRGNAANSDWRAAINRFNMDGSLDNSFAINGSRLLELSDDYEIGNSAAIDKNGNIVVVGNAGQYEHQDAFVVRLTPDGQLDPRFGDNGLLAFNFSAGGEDLANKVAIDAKERILVAGQSGDSLMIARLIGSDYEPPLPPVAVDAHSFRAWPNPVGNTLNIEYALPESGFATLELWDMAGRWVTNLLDKAPRVSRLHTESLTLDDFIPNGAYMLRFCIGDFMMEQQVVVVR